MSSCCDTNIEDKSEESLKEEKEPTNFIKKILWKIGKADSDKNHSKDENSCCS